MAEKFYVLVVGKSIEAECRLWITSGPSAAPPRRSVPGGRADEIRAKADFGARMSAVRGKADVPGTRLDSLLVARNGERQDKLAKDRR